MAELNQPLLSTSYSDIIDEIELSSFSPSESIRDQKENRVEPAASDDNTLPPGKDYHLFVSYSSEDRTEANTIRQHLEERFYLKCLYYERDFQIGRNIDENITEGLQKSAKTLVLLSPFFIQSHWCVTEAREACKLSFTDMENHNVIPVILRPLNKDLPPFLSSYVYIDAQKEMDVARKIYEAFIHPGIVDPLQMSKSVLSCNGSLLFKKKAVKANYIIHGLAFRFSSLEQHEEEKIRQNGVDLTECKTHYNSIISDLNKKCLFQNYPVFSSLKWRCILLCTVTTAFNLILIASLFLSDNNSSYLRNKTYSILNFSLGLPFLFCICPCGLIIIYGCRKKLHVFKYDITDCENYLLSLLGELRQEKVHGDSRTNEEIMKDLVNQQLKELQSTQALIKWTRLRESALKRHRTSNNRACICEILEDSINKTYGPVETKV